MRRLLGGLVVWFVLFLIAAMAVGSVSEFIPTTFQDFLGYIVIPAAILWFLYSWFRWHRKQAGAANELEWLEELAHEHKQGIRDHSEKLEWLIRVIEKEHEPSAALTKRLENVRRILKDDQVEAAKKHSIADYRSVIAGAISSLPSNTGEARQDLYDRARSALTELQHHDPPLTEAEITRERLALETAIGDLEQQWPPSTLFPRAEADPCEERTTVSKLTALCNNFTPQKLPAIVGNNWSDVAVDADAPSKRAFLAYALTLTAAGRFWRDITDDGKSNEFKLSLESDVILAEALIFFWCTISYQAVSERRDNNTKVRSAAVPTETDLNAIQEALPLIYATIEDTTGWVIKDIMSFRLSCYSNAKSASELIAQFASVICRSIGKRKMTDSDRVRHDLEVVTTLSTKVNIHALAFLEVYYKTYKNALNHPYF
jgi:hypothetical protein